MTRQSTATAFQSGVVFFLLFVLLFVNGIWGTFAGFFNPVIREVTDVFYDPEVQWAIFLCLGIYFTVFISLRSRMASGFWRATNSGLWLASTLLVSTVVYAFNYSHSVDALMLLAGATLGQGVAVWASSEVGSRKPEVRNGGVLVAFLLVVLLALASVWQTETGHILKYQYHGHARWSGPWDNPNVYGLLMGVGIVLAVGQFVQSLTSNVQSHKAEGRSWKLGARKYAVVILFLFAAGLMARGLLYSYSRGAWVAAVCGLAYLFWSSVQSPPVFAALRRGKKSEVQGRWIYWLKKNWLPFSVILASAFALSFGQFQHTEHKRAATRRVFSVANANDFSWRNRVAAWEGTLQIMAEHPWLGAGWNQPESLYGNYYLPPKVDESAAIQLNDYLVLGASLGVPALICFGMYLWLSLGQKTEDRRQISDGGIPSIDLRPLASDLWHPTCRAGAIVLLVGFWFDGGLFRLPTAATFWILLELGATESTRQKAIVPSQELSRKDLDA